MKAVVTTDGASSPNPGRGSWCAIITVEGSEYQVYGVEDHTTNNRMEMTAALRGIEKAVALGASEITVISDSQYLVKGIERRSPHHDRMADIPNGDLWINLLDYCSSLPIDWIWVKGHAETRNNIRCDQRCSELLDRKKKKTS